MSRTPRTAQPKEGSAGSKTTKPSEIPDMARKPYEHSAYWYAYHFGWTYSEAKTYAGKYLDIHTYRPRMREVREGESYGKAWFAWRNQDYEFDSTFNPLLLGACAMVDVGVAMRDTVKTLADPAERDRMRRELVRDLRAIRRPFYYAREKARRRELAAARRKITRRTTTAPMPTPEELLAAWNARKGSREAMVRLGGMLHDLACYVDSCLRFDESGDVAGRNGGIKEWLRENVPELSPKYKTLMRYKAMAMRLRQATGTEDPKPTAALLDEKPRHGLVAAILEDGTPVFSRVFSALEHALSPEAVFLDAAKPFENFPHANLKHGGGKERKAGKPAARADSKLRRKARRGDASRRRRPEK